LDCCASALEKEATAISPATADTFGPELFSKDSPTSSTVATERNDRGATARPIFTRPKFPFHFADADHDMLRRSRRIEGNKSGQFERVEETLESIQIKTILTRDKIQD